MTDTIRRNNLSIITWNANGLRGRINEFRIFMTEHSPDVACIQETKLSPSHDLRIPNYSVYRVDKKGRTNVPASGGTAVLVKQGLTHELIQTPETVSQTTAVRLAMGRGESVTIVSVYVPCGRGEGISEDIRSLLSIDRQVIIAGDFNAHHGYWNCSRDCAAGRSLYDLIISEDLNMAFPNAPTIFRSSDGNTIDFAVFKLNAGTLEAESLAEMTSDHNPVKFHAMDLGSLTIRDHRRVTNWKNFNKLLGSYSAPLAFGKPPGTPAELDGLVSDLTVAFGKAHGESQLPPRPAEGVFIPRQLRGLIKWRNKLRKIWQVSRGPADKSAYKIAQKIVREEINKETARQWRSTLENLNTGDGSVWRLAKSLRRNKEVKMGRLRGKDRFVFSDGEKAEVMADSLQEQFKPNPADDPHCEDEIESLREEFDDSPSDGGVDDVLPSEILHFFRDLKPNKAPGLDCITNKALKNIPPSTLCVLVRIINSILRLSFYPNSWRVAKVLAIHKSGKDPTDPKSFRPISLLSSLSKLVEAVILKRLNDHLTLHEILIPEQYGFRPGHSTTHQLYRVIEFIKERKGRRHLPSAGVLFDIEKAVEGVLTLFFKEEETVPLVERLEWHYLFEWPIPLPTLLILNKKGLITLD